MENFKIWQLEKSKSKISYANGTVPPFKYTSEVIKHGDMVQLLSKQTSRANIMCTEWKTVKSTLPKFYIEFHIIKKSILPYVMVVFQFLCLSFYTEVYLSDKTGRISGSHLYPQRWAPALPKHVSGNSPVHICPRSPWQWQRSTQACICRFHPFKGKEETQLLPPTSWGTGGQDRLMLNDFQVKFVIKHPRGWNAIGCLKFKN